MVVLVEEVVDFPEREITAPTPAIIIITIMTTTATVLLIPEALTFIKEIVLKNSAAVPAYFNISKIPNVTF